MMAVVGDDDDDRLEHSPLPWTDVRIASDRLTSSDSRSGLLYETSRSDTHSPIVVLVHIVDNSRVGLRNWFDGRIQDWG